MPVAGSRTTDHHTLLAFVVDIDNVILRLGSSEKQQRYRRGKEIYDDCYLRLRSLSGHHG